MEDKNLLREREGKIRSITIWSVLVNILLMTIKIFSGILIRSSALIADGFHSLSDLATDSRNFAPETVSLVPQLGHVRSRSTADDQRLAVGWHSCVRSAGTRSNPSHAAAASRKGHHVGLDRRVLLMEGIQCVWFVMA